MGKNYVHTDEASLSKWRGIITDCKNSKMPLSQWCRENDVKREDYYRYLRYFMDSVVLDDEPAEIQDDESDEDFSSQEIVPVSFPASNADTIHIYAGDIIIELPDSSSDSRLKTVIEALKYAG